MGYLSRVTGRIEITPPLPWHAVRDSKFVTPKVTIHGLDVRYEVAEETRHTDDGVFVARSAVAVVNALGNEQCTAYHLAEHLAEIGREITAAGSTCTGYLVRSGDELGDIERYGFGPNGEVVAERASLRWPDGSEVEE